MKKSGWRMLGEEEKWKEKEKIKSEKKIVLLWREFRGKGDGGGNKSG